MDFEKYANYMLTMAYDIDEEWIIGFNVAMNGDINSPIDAESVKDYLHDSNFRLGLFYGLEYRTLVED